MGVCKSNCTITSSRSQWIFTECSHATLSWRSFTKLLACSFSLSLIFSLLTSQSLPNSCHLFISLSLFLSFVTLFLLLCFTPSIAHVPSHSFYLSLVCSHYFFTVSMCPSAVSLLISFYVLPSLALFRVVSAVLQFGNMAFKQERSSEQAIMPSNEGEFFLSIHLIQVVYNSIQNLSTYVSSVDHINTCIQYTFTDWAN